MTDKAQNESSYGVGYGKPPKHSQWKKGQSGNPTGKRSKEMTLRAKLKQLIGQEIVVQQNGVPTTMTMEEAMLRAVLMKAMKADMKPVDYVTRLLDSEQEKDVGAPEFEVGAPDLSVLETHVEWRGILEQARAECASETDGPIEEGDHDDDASKGE